MITASGSDAPRLLAEALARGAHRLARELWEKTLGNSREGFEAYEQLAIHYEHRVREPQYALAIVRKALAELCCANQLGAIAPRAYRQNRARFEHRLARLERKADGTLLDALGIGRGVTRKDDESN